MSWTTFLEQACRRACGRDRNLRPLGGVPSGDRRARLERRRVAGRAPLTCGDAEETLAAFMDGDVPSAARFEEAVGGVIDEVSGRFPHQTIRAFGEMVDVLFQQGQESAAIALEELWNRLLESRRCPLLCGYELDVFDLDTQTSAVPEIVRTHTHPRPVADTARLAAAVHETLTDVLGSDTAARIYLRVAEEVLRTALPRAQAVLMWLSRHQPMTARRVLEGARIRYAQAV